MFTRIADIVHLLVNCFIVVRTAAVVTQGNRNV